MRGRSVGRVVCSLGKVCLFATTGASILREREGENWREGRAQSAGDIGEKCRVSMKEQVLSFSFVQTPCEARCVDFALSLTRDCESARA